MAMVKLTGPIGLQLRILAMHGAKTYPLVDFVWLFNHVLVIDIFKKCANIWKALSGGRAEIENVTDCTIF